MQVRIQSSHTYCSGVELLEQLVLFYQLSADMQKQVHTVAAIPDCHEQAGASLEQFLGRMKLCLQ